MKNLKPALWLLAGAIFFFFTGGRYNFWPAAWFSAVFFIRYFREGSFVKRYLLLILINWLIILVTWYRIQPSDPVSYAISMIVGTVFSSLPFITDRLLYKKVPQFASTLIFPIFATSIEYLFISGNPMGSFGALAYTQFDNLPFIQLVSITGLAGVSFVLNWFATAANHVWENKAKLKKPPKIAIIFLAVLALIYGYGSIRLLLPDNSETIKISGIFEPQENISVLSIMQQPEEQRLQFAAEVVDSYIEKTKREAAGGASIICWPEGAAVTDSLSFSTLSMQIAAAADELNIYLIVPYFIINEDKPFENKLHVYNPDGDTSLTHIKYGGNIFEGSIPGDGTIDSLETEYGRIAAVICWDMDFPAPILQTGKQDVDILFSPANEWIEIVPVHGQMAVFRGIENGLSTVHPASSGLSIIADPLGRSLATENWFSSPADVITASVPVSGRTTIYSRIGNLFPNMLILAALAIIIFRIVNKLRRKK